MTCKTCGNYAGGGMPAGTGTIGGSAGGCYNRKPMDTYKPLKQIQNGDKNFCFNTVTDEICGNLGSNKGIHPTKENTNNSCDDLKALTDMGIGDLHNSLITLDFCDINALKCWLFSFLAWLWNILYGIICTICGLRCEVDKLKQAVKDLAYANVGTVGGYDVLDETPGLSVTVRNDGSFTYRWSDWNSSKSPWEKLGDGVLTGKLTYSMNTNSEGGLDYNITSIYLDTVSYKATSAPGVGSNPTYYIQVPANGDTVWTRKGTTDKSWSEKINKKYSYSNKGSINPKSASLWINFMTWGADWVNNDKVQLKFKFENNNTKIDLDC